jgi:pentatricopeptide repeat protein
VARTASTNASRGAEPNCFEPRTIDYLAGTTVSSGPSARLTTTSCPTRQRTATTPTSWRAFVQPYHTDVLDASLLRMPKVGFIAPKDPMWTATLDAMDAELVIDSLVYRYDPAASPDGLRGSEGTFSLCTFAYVDALARAGRVEESRRAFEKMLTYANHVGLFSEEIALNGEQIGNFPQSFTHLALIDAAITLDAALDAG